MNNDTFYVTVCFHFATVLWTAAVKDSIWVEVINTEINLIQPVF